MRTGKNCLLVFEDGDVHKGTHFGYDGESCGERTLCHGDRIEVGGSILVFENEDFDEEDTATKNFATLA